MTESRIGDTDEISNADLENSIVSSLVSRFDESERTSYLASSTNLLKNSNETVTPAQLEEIFKANAKYYAGVKVVQTTLKHTTIFISPQLARDMLTFSSRGTVNKKNKNRRLSKPKVKKYAEAMKNREWCLTGEPIIISHEGEILNGHHRLEAACEARVGFIAPITYGVTDDLSFAHIDVGNIRSRSQVLEMAGVKVSASVLSRVAMLAKAFDMTKNPFAFRGTQGTSFQPAEILAYVEDHNELALSVHFISEIFKKHRLESQASETIYAFAHYLIKKQLSACEYENLPLCPETYLTRIISSLGLSSEDDIEYQVRNYLQSIVHESTSYSLLCKLSAIFKGWNSHLGLTISGNRIAVRRVARYKKDESGNKIPLTAAGNINEPFTVPCVSKGPTPKRIQKQSNVQIKQ
ncbi:chromosome partitioning protein ParB [Vibrio parahaemolyticus O5:K30]|uniref:chromosome partitioning protein ParB n=1 Tax=Vibrio TaxID=662 RepID=UPI0006A7E049|nr:MULTISPECIES: chromosome partitioning protein ParB [Vibrio]EJG0764378.1 chromosome partitioning protein ParB [Vibrio parahaemolyticus O5:K30]EJI1384865.1 chromosome partitioning protein ParB [Vibrio alginolyticus]EJL8712853.1 chromosome partitioning protein ParB [Vibrio alginolyticus]PNP28986.1 chromosome partitioning protein ParB [Vibrio alginolyticus]USD75708.1 chromosome partitioning protein ParB [Vibrio sp. SCSIO 43009]